VFSRVIDGHFPDHEAVTPADLPGSWTLDRKELADALHAVMPATTEKTRAVRFTLMAADVELFAKSADVGEARAVLKAHGTEELTVVLNPDYVLDYLAALPRYVEQVVLQAKARDVAVLWRGPAGHEYVQMPLTVNL
jgi:DNA polymerase-3 subunit beta